MSSRARVTCPHCQRSITVTDGGMGTLRPHGKPPCPGSRQPTDQRKDAK